MKKRIILLILIFLNLATMFFFSHQTGEQSGALSDGISRQLEIRTPDYEAKNQGEKNVMHAAWQKFLRRMAHVLLFLILGILVFLWLATYPIRWYSIMGGLLFGVLCAFGDELHQLYVPGRTSEWEDVLHDMRGFLAGMAITALIFAICYLVKRHKKRAENN